MATWQFDLTFSFLSSLNSQNTTGQINTKRHPVGFSEFHPLLFPDILLTRDNYPFQNDNTSSHLLVFGQQEFKVPRGQTKPSVQ
jgi:hypothetical protein